MVWATTAFALLLIAGGCGCKGLCLGTDEDNLTTVSSDQQRRCVRDCAWPQ
jgi:hypothetical protein